MKARAAITAESGADGPRLRWRSDPPVVLRPTGGHEAYLVQAGGGPLGGDELALDVHLGERSCLRVRSAGATVVQPGDPAVPARWMVTADLAGRAALDWHPEPTVICDGAHLCSTMAVALRSGARAVLHETVVLGRAGQRGGLFRGELTIDYDGGPILAHTLLLDGSDPVLTGPAGSDGARAVGMLAVVGEGTGNPPVGAGEEPGLRWACSALEGPGWLLLALGSRVTDVTRLLDQAASSSAECGVFDGPSWLVPGEHGT
ncbi:MAG: urease accessory protein UreD [Pseudonocardiaceae bacterium]